MRRTYFCLSAIVMVYLLTGMVFAQDDVKAHPSCQYCGMDREKFGRSRILIEYDDGTTVGTCIEYDDGTTVGTCSLRCAAVDLAIHIDKTLKTVMVGDYNTKTLIDVEKAFWVVGGNQMGVMTQMPKWAFDKKEDAEKFIKDHGGRMAVFDEAIKSAYEDMYWDTKMIRERRKMMKENKTEHKHK